MFSTNLLLYIKEKDCVKSKKKTNIRIHMHTVNNNTALSSETDVHNHKYYYKKSDIYLL